MLRLKKKDPLLGKLDELIGDIHKEMMSLNSDSDEYAEMTKRLSELITTRTKLQSEGKISPDTWALVLANLGGILLILNYERVNVVATKALGFVSKTRI